MFKSYFFSGFRTLLFFVVAIHSVVSQQKFNNSDILSLNFTDTILQSKPDASFYGYEAKSWSRLIKDYKFDSSGLADLAWKTGSTLEAFYLLYDLTSNSKFGDLHVNLTDDIIKRRDDKIGLKAWNGKTLKCWSSGNRYNYGYYDLYNIYGKNLGRLEFKDAKLDELYITIVKSKTTQNFFDINISNLRNNKSYKLKNTSLSNLEKDIMKINWSSYVSNNPNNNVINFVSYIDVNQANVDIEKINNTRIQSYYVPNIDVNAIYINNLINSYLILLKKNENKKAKEYFRIIEESIEVNTKLYLNTKNDNKWYFQTPPFSKTTMGGGIPYPYNKQFAYAAMLSRWFKITKNENILLLLSKWKNYFLSKVEKTDNGYVWKYWDEPTKTISWYETQNYGSHDIKHLMTIYENCNVFSKQEIIELTRAIRENLIDCNTESVKTKTNLEFKYSISKLPSHNYLVLREIWNDLIVCYKTHININDLHWTERVFIRYFLKKPSN